MNDATEVVETIRRTELAAARRVEEARDEADRLLTEARATARRLEEEAEAAGRERARSRLEEERAAAAEEASRITTEGASEATELKATADEVVGDLVDALVEALLAPPSQREV